MSNKQLVNVDDYRRAARKALPRVLYDFVSGYALDAQTGNRNHDGFSDWWLRARSFASNSNPDISVELGGHKLDLPVLIAPTGCSGLLWPRGEAEAARAAGNVNTIMEVSAGSILSMEDIAAAGHGQKWLQIFLYCDRGLTREFIARAKDAGYTGIVVTTDAPVHGRREQDYRNGFAIDQRLSLPTMLDAAVHYRWWMRMAGQPRFQMANFASRSDGDMNDMAAYIASVLNPDITWDDLSWLREEYDGFLTVKGILHPQDANEAIARGVNAIQISNHGGRQLDSTLSCIDALPAVAEAVDKRVPILLDGGIERGTSVLKAIALGADACVIGRSHLWGMAVAGGDGVEAILNVLRMEIINAMTIGGWKSLAEIGRDSITRTPGHGD
ncbi:alpha-hydroxy acid oxidase [Aminobacter aminovorans]|uniref:alpha-hydroxy acid oxidase n=1 Tax=Aminobacter TaxID=31988 RepID=UPI00285A72EB|nr:alpha-hydroxy acid oxidase [Aminobacter aminovorans]MDR7223702.1 isopentenyl diphosphate isomerase/L-lactate dehydrogenase-like FMN-dependent dehydrogenase [Aminobacter aminovorans]